MAGLPLIAGYVLAYKIWRDIWIVSALSICTVLLAEPAVVYALYREWPVRGAALGMLFGLSGLVCTLWR